MGQGKGTYFGDLVGHDRVALSGRFGHFDGLSHFADGNVYDCEYEDVEEEGCFNGSVLGSVVCDGCLDILVAGRCGKEQDRKGLGRRLLIYGLGNEV